MWKEREEKVNNNKRHEVEWGWYKKKEDKIKEGTSKQFFLFFIFFKKITANRVNDYLNVNSNVRKLWKRTSVKCPEPSNSWTRLECI